MNSMASGDPTTNSVFLVTTQNGYPVVPGIMSQVPLYPSNQPQVHLIPGNPPNLMPYVNEQPAQRALKEGKALGAVQIMIGLIHIGFGSILATALNRYYAAVSFYSGFPFWGGIFFIISGTLSVKAEKEPGSTSLLNASVGMNIISTVFAAVGSVLFITDLNISSTYIHLDYHTHSPYWIVNPGVTISWVLLIFCLLEFCVASTLSHFGSQLTCYQRNNVSMVFSNVCTSNPMVVPEPENPPPEYSVEDPNSK